MQPYSYVFHLLLLFFGFGLISGCNSTSDDNPEPQIPPSEVIVGSWELTQIEHYQTGFDERIDSTQEFEPDTYLMILRENRSGSIRFPEENIRFDIIWQTDDRDRTLTIFHNRLFIPNMYAAEREDFDIIRLNETEMRLFHDIDIEEENRTITKQSMMYFRKLEE